MLLIIVPVGLVAATWLGYPLVIAAIAHRRVVATTATPSIAPTVTCVVATRDDAWLVQRRVANLLASDYPADRLDVIVALDAAGAPAAADLLAGADARLSVVVGDAPGGKAAALNAGVRAARGDVLVFTDAQQTFAPDAVRHLVAALADPAVGAVSGALDLPGDGGRRSPAERYWSMERRLRRDEARIHSAIGVTGAIYAMRRERWTPLPAGVILDDVYTPMRLVLEGFRVGFTPAARAADARRTSADQEYRRKVRTLTGVIQLCAWLPGVLVPGRNPVWAQFVFHKLLRLLTPYLLLLAAVATLAELAARSPARTFWLGALAVAIAGLAASLLPRVGPRVRGLVVWGVTLQAAIVVATVNGVRGRWDVWHRPG